MDEVIHTIGRIVHDIRQYFATNNVSILTNIISSFIFFVLGGLLGLYSRIKAFLFRTRIQRVWKFGKEVYVLSGSKKLDSHDQTVIRHGDFYSTIDVINFFNNWFPKTKAVISEVSRTENYDFFHNNDVVLIGGPNNNQLTKKLFSELERKGQLRVKFDGYCVCALHSTAKYCLQVASDGDIVKDFGIIYKFRNPFNANCHVTVLAGCKSFATQACAKMFAREDFYNYLQNNRLGETFCLIVDCDVANDKLTFSSVVDHINLLVK